MIWGINLKFQHEIYLSEEEIGDLIWANWNEIFSGAEYIKKEFRELRVGNVVPDFIEFNQYPDGQVHIEIFELKITANMDSVRQICRYLRVVTEHIRIWFTENGDTRIPQVNLNLIARNIDHKIIDLCDAMGIGIWRVVVNSKTEIDVSPEYQDFVETPIDRAFIKKLGGVFNG